MRPGYGEAGKSGAKHPLPLIACAFLFFLRDQQRFLQYLLKYQTARLQ
jgi:hypothetical protein